MSQFDWKHPTVAMIGSFQPWTDEHTAQFKEIIERTQQVVIWVQEPDSDKRPEDFIFVRDNIQRELNQFGFNHEEEYVIQPVPYVTEVSAVAGEYNVTHYHASSG